MSAALQAPTQTTAASLPCRLVNRLRKLGVRHAHSSHTCSGPSQSESTSHSVVLFNSANAAVDGRDESHVTGGLLTGCLTDCPAALLKLVACWSLPQLLSKASACAKHSLNLATSSADKLSLCSSGSMPASTVGISRR